MKQLEAKPGLLARLKNLLSGGQKTERCKPQRDLPSARGSVDGGRLGDFFSYVIRDIFE